MLSSLLLFMSFGKINTSDLTLGHSVPVYCDLCVNLLFKWQPGWQDVLLYVNIFSRFELGKI